MNENYDEEQERLDDRAAHEADMCDHCDGTGVEPDEWDGRNCSICRGSGFYGT